MAAFDLASALANYDLQESSVRRYLADKIQELARSRDQGIKSVQNNASSRGLLHSTIALNDVADVNSNVDRQIGSTQADVNDQLMGIARGRVDANNQYQLYLQELAKQNAAAKSTFDPQDPLNWKGIDAAIKSGQVAAPAPAPAENPDPLNWAAIDAAIRSGQIADPRLTPKPAASTKPRSTPKPLVSKPAVSTRPKQGYY